MANFYSTVGTDFLNPIDAFTSIDINKIEVADSRAVIFKNVDTTHTVFFGNFSYPTPTTVTGIIDFVGWVSPEYGSGGPFQTYMRVENMGLSVGTFISYVNTQDPIGLRAFVFGGNDTLNGSETDDRMLGFNGNDLVFGNSGNDDINGNQGFDTMWGGYGNDNVRGGQNEDYVNGQAGNDTVNGNIGNDSVYGGDGDDWVLGGQNDDHLYGEAGNDLLSGDLGNDTLTGGAGNNVFLFNVNAGNDVITDFISGSDQIWVTAALAASVGNSFAAAAHYEGADTILTTPTSQTRIIGAHVLESDVFIV